MFRTVPLSIMSSFSLYTQQTCMTYTTAMCTVKNCWWWTEELSETCRDLFQKQIWEISASSWFCYMNLYEVFTIMHLKQPISLRYAVLWLFCGYVLWQVHRNSPWKTFCTFTSALPAVSFAVHSMGCLVQCLDLVLSRYVAHVLSELFWNGSSCHRYYWYHFRFWHSTHAVFA